MALRHNCVWVKSQTPQKLRPIPIVVSFVADAAETASDSDCRRSCRRRRRSCGRFQLSSVLSQTPQKQRPIPIVVASPPRTQHWHFVDFSVVRGDNRNRPRLFAYGSRQHRQRRNNLYKPRSRPIVAPRKCNANEGQCKAKSGEATTIGS